MGNVTDIRAMILAAGHGTRLGALGADRPKPMLPVGTRPLVEHVFHLLASAGIGHVILNSFTHADALECHVGDKNRFGLEIAWSRETGQILGTGGGIKNARWFFGDQPCVVANGKIVTTLDLSRALAFHRASGAGATLVLRPDPDASRWGGFALDPKGRVVSMLGQSIPGEDPVAPTHMFTGISVLEPGFLDYLPDGPHCLVREGLFPWFSEGRPLAGFSMSEDDYWWDHSTPSRYLLGNLNLFSPGLRPHFTDLPWHPSHPDVIAAPGFHLGENVHIDGPVVLGPGAVVAPGVRLGNVVVWENQRVEHDLWNTVVCPGGPVSVDLSDPGARTGPTLRK